MQLNYIAILVATILQFIFGAIWYMPIFGNLWGKIHGFDKVPKEEQEKMMKGMTPFLVIQFITTFVTSFVLALFVAGLPSDWNVFGIAGFFWIGFIVPTQISGVIFGGTEGKWVMKKILIMAGGALGCMMLAALTFHFFK